MYTPSCQVLGLDGNSSQSPPHEVQPDSQEGREPQVWRSQPAARVPCPLENGAGGAEVLQTLSDRLASYHSLHLTLSPSKPPNIQTTTPQNKTPSMTIPIITTTQYNGGDKISQRQKVEENIFTGERYTTLSMQLLREYIEQSSNHQKLHRLHRRLPLR